MPHSGTDGAGPAEVTYQTSVYDYYNWDSTRNAPTVQYSDSNDLHRAGWAQNYEVMGGSERTRVTVPQ